MKKVILQTLFGIIAFFSFLASAQPCSFITHGEVAERAIFAFDGTRYPEYKGFLEKHRDALQGGAVFPDWGYGFGSDEESEAAHWDPFIQAAADHFHRKYPPPWNKKDQKYISFLLGTMSHSQADISWHALAGFEEGFLTAMAHTNFNGVWSDAHGQEVGGDILCDHELDTSWLTSSWYTPIDDIVEVYHELGYTNVNAFLLTLQTGKLLLAAKLGLENSSFLYGNYANKSPFLAEQFQDYFSGGLDEMGIRSARRFEEVIGWIENGLDEVAPSSSQGDPSPHPTTPDFKFLQTFFREVSGSRLELSRTEGGVVFSVHQNTLPEPFSPVPFADPSDITPRTLSLTNGTLHSYLGTSLAHGDFNGDGLDDLAIGAPGYTEEGHPQMGAVYVVFGRTDISGNVQIDLRDHDDVLVLLGEEDFSRFGFAVATLDFNADGYVDLAVSAPTTGSGDISYPGKVFVIPGVPDKSGLATDTRFVIETQDKHTNLGISLSGGDINGDGVGDLIIGSPFARAGGVQRGLVAVFWGEDREKPYALSLADANWTARGESDYDWFGYHVDVIDGLLRKRLLVVGAPGFGSAEGRQDIGRIYGFWGTEIATKPAELAPAFTISGMEQFDKTGQFFAAGSPAEGLHLLAISSPSRANRTGILNESQAGAVHFLLLENANGDVSLDEVEKFGLLRGNDSYERFGWRVGFADWNGDGADDFWSTSPWRKTGAGVQAGASYLWLGGSDFLEGGAQTTASSATARLDYGNKQSRFGTALAFLDFNGDGCEDTAIGARRSSLTSRQGGEVVLLIAPESENCRQPASSDADADVDADTDADADGDVDADTDWEKDSEEDTEADENSGGVDSEDPTTPSDEIDKQGGEDPHDAAGSESSCGCVVIGAR